MKQSKLVRDRIPEIIRANGGTPVTHIADDAEYGRRLKEKLQEEVGEFLETGTAEELIDILEVLDAIATHREFGPEEIKEMKQLKALKRGGFRGRVILEES